MYTEKRAQRCQTINFHTQKRIPKDSKHGLILLVGNWRQMKSNFTERKSSVTYSLIILHKITPVISKGLGFSTQAVPAALKLPMRLLNCPGRQRKYMLAFQQKLLICFLNFPHLNISSPLRQRCECVPTFEDFTGEQKNFFCTFEKGAFNRF